MDSDQGFLDRGEYLALLKKITPVKKTDQLEDIPQDEAGVVGVKEPAPRSSLRPFRVAAVIAGVVIVLLAAYTLVGSRLWYSVISLFRF